MREGKQSGSMAGEKKHKVMNGGKVDKMERGFIIDLLTKSISVI